MTADGFRRADELHVVLDSLSTARRLIEQQVHEPWAEYDDDGAEPPDPKATRDGYLDVIESAAKAATEELEGL